MRSRGITHVDLSVADLERSIAFYRGLGQSLGWDPDHVKEVEGERGETITYLGRRGSSIGLHQAEATEPPDRYAVGLHHVCFEVEAREQVDAAHQYALAHGARDDGPPGERRYQPGYYACFFLDPSGIKVEVVHLPEGH